MRRHAATLLLGMSVFPGFALAQSGYQTLRQFKGYRAGCSPTAGLTAGLHGEFYGITFGCGQPKSQDGNVFMLTPPAAGSSAWGFKVIWQLHSDEGAEAGGRLLLGQDGALYGTTSAGDVNRVLFGSVYRLAPPAVGGTTWRFTLLWKFGPHDVNHGGGVPESQLMQDDSGALYGTTTLAGGKLGNGLGTIFKLTPGAAGEPWTYEVLASTGVNRRDGGSPLGALTRDAAGVLYGTAAVGGVNNYGTVFSLTPPAAGDTTWTYRDIVQFAYPESTPTSGVIAGPDGDFYGSTFGLAAQTAGTLFRTIPPHKAGDRWTEQTIYQFHGLDGAGPMGGLTPDGAGGFFGSTFLGGADNNGTLFHIRPKSDGTLPWALTPLYHFSQQTGHTTNIQPNGDLVLDSAGALLGTTLADTRFNTGSVFRFLP